MDEFKFCHRLKSEKSCVRNVFLVTNEAHYQLYLEWGKKHNLPASHIINDGSTSNDNRLGAIQDIALVLEKKGSASSSSSSSSSLF